VNVDDRERDAMSLATAPAGHRRRERKQVRAGGRRKEAERGSAPRDDDVLENDPQARRRKPELVGSSGRPECRRAWRSGHGCASVEKP